MNANRDWKTNEVFYCFFVAVVVVVVVVGKAFFQFFIKKQDNESKHARVSLYLFISIVTIRL